MPFYAQIDGADQVVAVTQTHREISNDRMIPIPALDNTLINKIYNASQDQFDDALPIPPEVTPKQKAAQAIAGVNIASVKNNDTGKLLVGLLCVVLDIDESELVTMTEAVE